MRVVVVSCNSSKIVVHQESPQSCFRSRHLDGFELFLRAVKTDTPTKLVAIGRASWWGSGSLDSGPRSPREKWKLSLPATSLHSFRFYHHHPFARSPLAAVVCHLVQLLVDHRRCAPFESLKVISSSLFAAIMPPKVGSVEVGEAARKGEGRARRCYISPDKLSDIPAPGVTVLYDILQRSAEKYANDPALGWRDVIRMIDEEKEVSKMIGGQTVSPTLLKPCPHRRPPFPRTVRASQYFPGADLLFFRTSDCREEDVVLL